MADTIEQLDIKISASAERSTKAVSKLASVLQRLKSVAGGLSSTASSVGNGISRIANSFKSSSKETEKLSAELDKVDKKFQKLMDKQEKMEALGIKHDSRAWKSLQYDMVKTGKEWETLRDKLSASKQNNVSGIFKGLAVNLGNAFKAPLKGLQAFGKQLLRIGRYRAIRALLQDMGKSFEYLYTWSSAFGTEYAGSMDRIATSTLYLRNSIAAMAAPLVQALAPAIDFLIDKIVTLINWLNHLFAILGGKATYTVAKKSATAWKEAAKGAGGAAAELKRTLLGFDEINRLADESGGGGGGGGGLDAADMFEERAVSSLFAGFSDAIHKALENSLSRVALIVAGAATAIGAILLFSGHPLLGLGMMIPGLSAAFTTVAMNWDEMPDQVRNTATKIMSVLGGSLLALGAILAFATTHKALGIGLMISGAATLGSAVALNWNSIVEAIAKVVRDIGWIVGGALLAIGAVLAFSGANIPWGIGLMAAGAASLATSVVLNWQLIVEKIRGPLGQIVEVIGTAFLALGALLAFTGANLPLGIALMAAGAAGLAVVVPLRWDIIKAKLQGPLGEIVQLVSVALLAVGALLAFSGVNIPLGIAMMAAGAISTVVVTVLRWDILQEKLRGTLGEIVAIISVAFLALGAILAFSGANIPLGIALMAAGAIGIGVTAAAWGTEFVGKIADVVRTVVGIIAGASLFLGIVMLLLHNYPIGFALIAAGIVGLVASSSADWGNLRNIGLQAHNEVAAGWNSGGSVVLDVVTKVTQVIETVQTYTDTAGQMFSDPVGFMQETDKNTQQLGGVGGVLGRIWDGMNGGSGSSTSGSSGVNTSSGSGKRYDFTGGAGAGGGKFNNLKIKALGGIFSGGAWRNIPQFAGGGGLHGSIFWAGENGPEIVGHVGGRTEVLNKSQLASAMYAAVRSAMAPAAANYADAAMYLYNGGAAGKGGNSTLEEGIETMESMLALLRQQNAEFVQALENFRVECDGETLGRAAIRGINTYQQRTGKLAITL